MAGYLPRRLRQRRPMSKFEQEFLVWFIIIGRLAQIALIVITPYIIIAHELGYHPFGL